MAKAGSIVVSTELETKQFEKGVDNLVKKAQQAGKSIDKNQMAELLQNIVKDTEDKMKELTPYLEKYSELMTEYLNLTDKSKGMLIYESDIQDASQLKQEIREVVNEIEKLTGERINIAGIDDAKDNFNVVKTNINEVDKLIKNVGKSINGVVKKIVRWGLAVFGIRGAYTAVRNAMSIITQQDAQLKADVDYMKNAIAYTLEPVVRVIVNLAKQLMFYIGYVVKAFTGKNIFENANKSLKAANGQAKELQKTLFGFDKLNILNSNSGGGSEITSPSFDLTDESLFKKWNLEVFIEKGKEIAANIAYGINQFFEKMDWSALGKGLSNALIGIIDIIITFIREVDWKLIGQSIADFLLSVDWIGLAVKIFELIINGMLAVMDLMEGITDGIIEKLEDPQFWKDLQESGGKIFDKLVEGMGKIGDKLETIWSKIISWFLKKLGINDNDAEKVGEKIGEGIHHGIDFAIEHLPFFGTFYKIIKFAKLAFGIHSPSKEFQDIGSNLMQGLKNGITDGINGVIDIINSLIRKINNALSFKWNKIEIAGIKLLDAGSINVGRIPTIPRLAKGNIINMPGRGVDYHGANIGERRPEGIVPLDNETSLRIIGETIAKYTKFNADITLELEGRILARVLEEINADRRFARNGG